MASPGSPISAMCCQVASLNPRGSSITDRTARGADSRDRNSRVRSRSMTCSCVKSKSICSGPRTICARLTRQLQHTVADDVLLNLARSRVDGAGTRPQKVVRPRTIVAARRAGVQCELRWETLFDLTVRPEYVLHQLLVPLVELTVVQLVHGRFGPRSFP